MSIRDICKLCGQLENVDCECPSPYAKKTPKQIAEEVLESLNTEKLRFPNASSSGLYSEDYLKVAVHNSETLARAVLKLEEDLERERMRLVACGVAALGNTRKSVAERITKDNPYYSASYADVCRAVDAEIVLREEKAGLVEALEQIIEDCNPAAPRSHNIILGEAIEALTKVTDNK